MSGEIVTSDPFGNKMTIPQGGGRLIEISPPSREEIMMDALEVLAANWLENNASGKSAASSHRDKFTHPPIFLEEGAEVGALPLPLMLLLLSTKIILRDTLEEDEESRLHLLTPQELSLIRTCSKLLYLEKELQVAQVVCALKQHNYPLSRLPNLRSKDFAVVSSCAKHVRDNLNKKGIIVMGGRTGCGEASANSSTTRVDMLVEERVSGAVTYLWEECCPLLVERRWQTAAFYQGEIFSLSSFPGVGLGVVERYDCLSGKRSRMNNSLPHNIMRAAAVVFEDRLFLIGGSYTITTASSSSSSSSPSQQQQQDCWSNEVYTLQGLDPGNPAAGTWEPYSPKTCRLNIPRTGHAAVVYHGKIYVCGGETLQNVRTRSVEVFSPSSGAWEMQAESMTVTRTDFKLVVIKGTLFAVGGDDLQNQMTSIEMKDGPDAPWTLCTELRGESRFGSPVGVIGSKIFFFGSSFEVGTSQGLGSWNYFDTASAYWASQQLSAMRRYLPRSMWAGVGVSVTSKELLSWPPLPANRKRVGAGGGEGGEGKRGGAGGGS